MKSLQHYHDKDPWMLGEDIPNADLFFSNVWLHGFVNDFAKHTGRAYAKIVSKYVGYHLWFYFGQQDSFAVGENIARRIVGEPGYAARVNRHIIVEADKLRRFCDKIPQRNLDRLTDRQLWAVYRRHNEIHSTYYTWCWIPVGADMFHNNLTDKVKEYLRAKGVSDERITESFLILTQPTKKSLIYIEHEQLLKIAAKIVGDQSAQAALKHKDTQVVMAKFPPAIRRSLETHRRKYYYTKHLWVSGEYTIADYLRQLKEIFDKDQSPQEQLRLQTRELVRARSRRRQLFRRLKINGQWAAVFGSFGDFMVTKIYRRYAQLLAVHHMGAILREIARRRGISEAQVRCVLPEEMKAMLLRRICHPAVLEERTKLMVYYAERGCDKLMIGDTAREYLSTVERIVDTDVREIRGQPACLGHARGTVKIIIRASDMAKMKQGDILVSIATDPDIVSAMKKAAAIVTEQGGVTSHAAIVSRELNIPCVIGTKIATKVFKDGDEVEVDANRGVVTLLP
ncbi:MAG: pyruvate, water dikinase [Parcubacteria group bacterium Gr01-1014_31]|nr:MAG: pyruvate, water dikinase [Parcubacteria group bacterium Gr01-1014_31]